MNRSYKIIPTYTADVSGVCSALFELGGMVVMHDPSGCNSTYNTHDETRWYDHDSLIFISGLTEIDAILGNDNKLIDDVVSAAAELSPNFIALASAPIPYMNGTDFPAIARLIEKKTGIPTFFVPTNGMRDYVSGAGNALEVIARRFVRKPDSIRPHSVNLLGVTPLDFATKGSTESLRSLVSAHGWEVVACWAMGDTLETLERSGEAAVNLVVSAVGIPAAKALQQRFGTPYVVGAPIDSFGEEVFSALSRAEQTGTKCIPYLTEREIDKEKPTVTLIGEAVTMESLGAAITRQYGCPVRVLCPLERSADLIRPCDLLCKGEEEAETALNGSDIIVADPLYRPICPPDARFYELPHWAFSGRCAQKRMKNLFQLNLSHEKERESP